MHEAVTASLAAIEGRARRGVRQVQGVAWRACSIARAGINHFLTIQNGRRSPFHARTRSMFFKAMADAGVGPEATVMVGDTTFDIEMAAQWLASARSGSDWGLPPARAASCEPARIGWPKPATRSWRPSMPGFAAQEKS
jgi:hypothetical protein